MQLRCAGDWRLLYTKHSGGSDPVRSQAGKGPLLSTVAHHFHLGSRTLGCLTTMAHGYQVSEDAAQQRSMEANGPRVEGSY